MNSLWCTCEALEKGGDGNHLNRLDPVQAQEVVVATDKPADAGGEGTGNELGIVRVSDFWRSRWRNSDAFDKREQVIVQQASNIRLGELELGIGQDANRLIEYRSGDHGPKPSGLPGWDKV